MGLINWEAVKRRELPNLLLDLCMLAVAIVHLILIGFDTTYFTLRNFYYHNLPSVVSFYDPLKGVEPHRDTEAYMQKAREYFESCRKTGAISPSLKDEMILLSDQMIEENPFQQAGLTGHLEKLKDQMRTFTRVENSSKGAFETFWNQDCQLLETRSAFFEEHIAYFMKPNYWRRIDLNGRPVDYFFYVDLCFISIFLLEFLIMWLTAIRRFGPDQKILYPLYHWYDLISCIPLREFRWLRLLRVLAVYYRLIQTEIISIKDNPIYRRIMRISSIIEEEISDKVALNILSNIQDKTRLGTNRQLLEEIMGVYRDKIKENILDAVSEFDLPTLELKHDELVHLISSMAFDSLQRTEDFQRLKQLPILSSTLPSLINEGVIARMVSQGLDAFTITLKETLKSPELRDILDSLIDDILDESIEFSRGEAVQTLIEDINIKVIEELKKSSTAKIWKAEKERDLLDKIQHIRDETDSWIESEQDKETT